MRHAGERRKMRTLDLWQEWSEVGKNLATVLAACIGGLWVYYNSVRGRVHKPLISCTVLAEPRRVAGSLHLLVRVRLENKGKGKIALLGRKAVEVWLPVAEDLEAAAVVGLSGLTRQWREPPYASEVLTGHQWLEPGEVIEDVKLVALLPKLSEPIIRLRFSGAVKGWRFLFPIRQGIGAQRLILIEKETSDGKI